MIVRHIQANFGGDFFTLWMDCVPRGVALPHTSSGDFDDSVYLPCFGIGLGSSASCWGNIAASGKHHILAASGACT